MIQVTLRFFAAYRERLKTGSLPMILTEGTTAAECFDRLRSDLGLDAATVRSTLFAINQEYVKPEAVLKDGDELAFIPPVSGG